MYQILSVFNIWSNFNFRSKLKIVINKLKDNDRYLREYAFVILVALYSACSYFNYSDYINNNKKIFAKTAQSIDNILNDVLTQHELLIQYIGNSISEHNSPNDLIFIQRILEKISNKEYNAKKLLTWSLFDWISIDDGLIVNQKLGIVNFQSINMNKRSYYPKAKKKPWALHLSAPDFGMLSNIWAIPAGFGITNKKGEFLGMLSMGFDIANLNMFIKERLSKELINISFVVLDEHYNLVLKSSDLNINNKDTYFKKVLKSDMFNEQENFLTSILKYNEINYNYYKKMNKYSYLILTGLDKSILYRQLFHLFFPLVIELLSVYIILLTIFHLYQKKYKQTAKAANKAKQQIVKKTMRQLQWDIESIFQHSNILLKYYKDELNIDISNDKKIELVSRIKEAAASLQKYSILNLDMNSVDMEKIINEIITIHSHNSFIKDIRLTKEIETNLPSIYANEHALKQILIGLISQILEYLPSGSKLHIKVLKHVENQNQHLKILLIDDGFSLAIEDFIRISEQISTTTHNDSDLINLDVNTIINLINLCNGTYAQSSLPNRGNIVTITFPYIPSKINNMLQEEKENSYEYH